MVDNRKGGGRTRKRSRDESQSCDVEADTTLELPAPAQQDVKEQDLKELLAEKDRAIAAMQEELKDRSLQRRDSAVQKELEMSAVQRFGW